MNFRKFVGLLCLILLFSIIDSYSQVAKPQILPNHKSTTFKEIESGFLKIPDSIQTSVYWYWLSGNVSKEGVVKDLESMKKVGINRAFIGDIGLNDVPYGKVKFLSNEWWEILHIALKTATRLNIEIGLFNGPGWSQAGGPWVKPEQAMRYLTSSEQIVKGPRIFNEKLSIPVKNFQDVKLLAYPIPEEFNNEVNALKPKLSSPENIDSLSNLLDKNLATGIHFKRDQNFSIDLNFTKTTTVRSVTIQLIKRANF